MFWRRGFQRDQPTESRVFCTCELCRLRFGRVLYPRRSGGEPLRFGRIPGFTTNFGKGTRW
jgi:hypothetical protein